MSQKTIKQDGPRKLADDDRRTDQQRWEEDGKAHSWKLPPPAPWPLRLPVIRHIRGAWNLWQIERHYAFFGQLGLVRTGYDEWVVFAIMRGDC